MIRPVLIATAVLLVPMSLAMGQSPSPGSPPSGSTPDLNGLSFGLPLRGGGINGGLSITAGQSFSRGMSTNAAALTVPNGVPGFVFGGTLQPFITGDVPVLANRSAYEPVRVSRIGRMMERGELQVRKDSNGAPLLILPEAAAKRRSSMPDPTPDRTDSFRRGIEKYGGSKL